MTDKRNRSSVVEQVAWAALVATAALAPFMPVQPLFRLPLFEMHTTPGLALLSVGLWLAHLLLARRRPYLPRRLAPALGLFLSLAFLSSSLAPDYRLEAVKMTARVGLGVVVCLAVADLAVTSARRWAMVLAVVGAGVVVAALGIAEYLAIGPALSFLGLFKLAPSQVGDTLRVSSTFGYATIASMYLELVIPLAVGLLWRLAQTGRPGLALVGGVGLAIIVQAMILTLTRSGLVATALALMLMAGAAWRGRQPAGVWLAAGAGALMVALVGVTALLTPTLGLRLRTENDRAWYGAVYAPAPLPVLAAGEVVTVTVQITNTGRIAWRPAPERGFSLSYHWLAQAEDSVAVWEGARTPITEVVEPAETVTLQARVMAPPHSGPVRLAWDMVQEGVAWFSAKAVPMRVTPVDVQPRQVPLPLEPPPILLAPMPRASAVDLSPSRRVLWGVALDMLRDRPWLGVGLDNFRLFYGPYTGQAVWDHSVHANNMYLEMFANLGIPGGLTFLLVCAATVWTGWTALRVKRDPILAVAVAAAMLAWLVHGLLDSFYTFLPLTMVYWPLLGLAAALARPRIVQP